jgi:hypothetical protein
MKTSKIIFISLLSAIALFIVAVFLDIRINGYRNGTHSSKMAGYTVNKTIVPSFKVLCISNSPDIHLIQNDSSYFELISPKDSLPLHTNYTIKDDTLRISDVESKVKSHLYLEFRINTSGSLKNIILKNSGITIENFVSDRMALDMDKSSVWLSQGKSAFNTLDITARNHSQISTNEFNVDSLGIILQNSEANLEIIASKLTGTLSDSSRISARQPAEISLKKDITSKINVVDY